MSDESDLSSEKQRPKQLSRKKSMSPTQKSRNFQPPSPLPSAISVNPIPIVQDQTRLYDQNRKLRRKLKQLSIRLDQQLQKAAQNKLKQQSLQKGSGRPVSLQSQPLQLQNAYKMIQRLQKTVHDYESKQSYQITLKRVLDLEGIIKKKQNEIETLKTQVKTLKKIIKDKERHVEELIQNSKKVGNPAQDIEVINRLKAKMRKIVEENDVLRKKELEKHQKLVTAQRKIVDLQQNSQMPIGKEQGLVKQIEDGKKKIKELMQRIQRQNIYISKLNQKLNKEGQQKSRKSQRINESMQKQSERVQKRMMVARSLQDLPSLQKKINTSQLLQHLPSPRQGSKLRRY